MIEKPKLLTIVIIVSLSGIIGLYAYAVSIEARTISIADLGPQYVGSLVMVEGYLKEVNAWSDGDLNLILVDYDSGKTVDVNIDTEAVKNLEHQEKMIPGAKIQVNGLVEDYKGDLLIHVRSADGIRLLTTARSEIYPLYVILDRPNVFEGMHVTVQGVVWDKYENSSHGYVTFILNNESGDKDYSVNCYLNGIGELRDRDGNKIYDGTEVVYEGIFEYYPNKGIWEITSNEGMESLDKVG